MCDSLSTTAPVTLKPAERVELVIEQLYGGRHTLGRFRIKALTGDAAELSLPAEIVGALKMYPEKRVAATQQQLFDYFAGQDPQIKDLLAKVGQTLARHPCSAASPRTAGGAAS